MAKQKIQTMGVSHAIQRQIDRVSYLFLLPMAVFFVCFVLAPMVIGIFTSFFNYRMGVFDFNFGKNYLQLFTDKVFWRSMRNTIVIVIVSVPLVTIFSLWVASALN